MERDTPERGTGATVRVAGGRVLGTDSIQAGDRDVVVRSCTPEEMRLT